MKKRISTMIYMLVGFVIITLALAGLFRIYVGRVQNKIEDTHYKRYYAFITEDNKSSFWKSIYNGAYQKGLEKNAYVELLGEKLGEQFSREDLMKIAITSDVDGIIVAAEESMDMTKLINEATYKGIPVVTLYNDCTQSIRCSYVGIGSYNLGVEYGRKVLEIVREGEKVNVAILVNSDTRDTSQNIFVSAIDETIHKNKNKEIDVSLVTVDNANSFSVEESIRDIIIKEDVPDIVICLSEETTTCLYQAVIDYNKVGQVHILGYFDSDTILNAIDKGIIDATASINTKQMGEFCIQALDEFYEYGNTSQYFIADIAFIHKLNVQKYLEEREN